MFRREFTRTAAQLAALASAGLLSPSVWAQAKAPVDGVDYLTLDKPASTEAAAGRIEVVEFFWYSCPHCNAFEPLLEAWAAKLSKNVAFRRVPVMFRPNFEPQQRLYYALEAMGKLSEVHKKVFNAIHNEKQTLDTAEQIAAWVGKQGLDKAKFMEQYASFPVVTKVRRATQLQEQYKVDGVPSMGVAGRYFTSGSLAGNMPRVLQVVDHLVAQAAKASRPPAKGAKG
jgi:thiol:disulfide interchange protein DsbA